MPDTQPAFHIHLVSDSTGETIRSVARASLAQFEHFSPTEHFWPMARTPKAMELVLEEVAAKPGPVIFTLVDDELCNQLLRACRALKVPCISVLDPVIAALGNYLGEQPSHRIGGQHQLDTAYFNRIEAMDWALTHDDGQNVHDIDRSDIVLVGVSRTSKTPTCLYLANRGIKSANVPYVPEVPLPQSLVEAKNPLIVGLTTDAKRLIEIRRVRLTSLHEQSETAYVDPSQVKEELTQARRFFSRQGWPVVDVTRRSIEESAAAIMTLYNRRLERRANMVAATAVPQTPSA